METEQFPGISYTIKKIKYWKMLQKSYKIKYLLNIHFSE